MNEKDMVLDILSGLKASSESYTKMIVECNDLNLRQTFQQLRQEAEDSQYNLYKICAKKGYYTPSAKETDSQIQKLKSELTQALTAMTGAGPIPVH